MSYQTIKFEVNDQGVATLVMNRPESFNAFNHTMSGELSGAVRAANRDEKVKVLVVTGAGKAFSSGGDISEFLKLKDNWEKNALLEAALDGVKAFEEFEKPLITAVNGVAAGAGTSIVMRSDIAIASENARFAPNFINIASVPDSCVSFYLTRLLGYRKALEILWTGKILSAQEAFDLGIYNRLVPVDDLMREAYALAERLAHGPTQAINFTKKLARAALTNDSMTQGELENYYQLMAWSTEDFEESIKAFMEKRKPVFKGR